MNAKTIRIMVDMSLILLHHGHIRILKKTREYFKDKNIYLVAGLCTDDEIIKHKGYRAELTYSQRKEILEAIKYVDEVVPTKWHIDEEFLDKHKIDYLVHGSDLAPSGEKFIIFPRTKGIASSDLRKKFVISMVQKTNWEKPMFTPDPANMSSDNLLDLIPWFGRGDSQYADIEKTVLGNILKLTGHDKIVRFQGAGTTAIDVATSNIVLGKILIIDAGFYSKRIETIYKNKLATLPNTSYKVIKYSQINEELKNNQDSYDWVVCAYAETAEAFLCDIHLLRKIADAKKSKLYLDATASINLEDHHNLADVCSFSSCKGLGGLAGGAFITYKKESYNSNKDQTGNDLPFSLNLATHINKSYTGPYHVICSLFSISQNFKQIRDNIRASKNFFCAKYKNILLRELKEQPLVSTIIKTISVTTKKGIIYQPRTGSKNTAVICHFVDMFTELSRIGQVYQDLTIVDFDEVEV